MLDPDNPDDQRWAYWALLTLIIVTVIIALSQLP